MALRVAIVNQAGGGGATGAAKEALIWDYPEEVEILYAPDEETEREDGLWRALEEFRPDVVHAHCWYGSYPYDLLLRLSQRWPVALTVHDVAVVNQYDHVCWECTRNPWCFGCPSLGARRWRPNYRMIDRLKKRRINRKTELHLVYPCEWMRQRLRRSEWGSRPSSLIPYSIDTELFSPGAGERHETPTILFVGHMYSEDDHRKGLPILLDAFRTLRETRRDVRLLVAGQVHASGSLPDGVEVLGSIDRPRLVSLYRGCELYCLPTLGDNSPVTLQEAMSCGAAVVATRVGGIPELIEHDRSGLLVTPGDAPELAAALGRLLGDQGLRARLGEQARVGVVEHCSRRKAARRHFDLWSSLRR